MLGDQTAGLHFVRHKLETFQSTILLDVEKRIAGMIDEVMQELRQHELQAHEFRNFAKTGATHNTANTWSNRMHHSQNPLEQTNSDALHETMKSPKSISDAEQKERHGNSSTIEREISNNFTEEEENSDNTHAAKAKRKNKMRRSLPDKVFITRESYLTALLEVDHMRTIYHIFYIIFMIFCLNNITYDFLVKGSATFGLGTIKGGFGKIHYVLGVWLLQHSFVFSIYYALMAWSHVRSRLVKTKSFQHMWSIACLTVYTASQITFAYIPTQLCFAFDLPYVTSCVLLLETIRMLMKMHSFVRTVGARIVNGKEKSDDAFAVQMPHFHKYLYYLFAPTLVYRDNYPRTSVIRWKFAITRFMEVVAVAFLYSYIYERHIKPHFGDCGKEEITAASLTVKVFGMLMPSIIIYLCGFYMILHSWLNCTAEVLRFGDRMFYRDWWTANNYEAYYRTWNVVVHDWLYEYIYKDFYTYIFKGSKLASSMIVFLISALFHEYILGYALKVFFPVMFVFFGVIGVSMIFLTRLLPKNVGNIILWFSLIYGNTLLICLYSMEYFSRINCPKESYLSWSDVLIPHLWSCYHK